MEENREFNNLTVFNTEKCKAGRFNMNESSLIKYGLNNFICPDQNFQIPFSGNFAGTSIQFFRIVVDYCDQRILNKTYPGKICKTKDEIDTILKDMSIDVYALVTTFDTKEFYKSPIKDTLRFYNFKPMPNLS